MTASITTAQPKPLVLLASRAAEPFHDLEVALLTGGFRVVTATTERDTVIKARSHHPHAIVVDAEIAPPGFALCELLRSDDAVSAATPIVLTRAPGGRSERMEAFRCGAWEVQHILDPDELLVRLFVFIQAKVEVTLLATECVIDRPSGLYNSAGLERRGEELSALTMRKGLALTCAVFRPTAVVDHAASNQLGRLFKAAGRTSDAMGRSNRDEFTVFAPATTAGGASRMVIRITDLLTRDAPAFKVRGAYSTSLAAQKVSHQTLLARARNALEGGHPLA